MIAAWIGVALLAGSWLFGLDYYYPASGWAWIATLVLGTVLLRDALTRAPARHQISLALVLVVFPAWFFPWPYRAAPLWMLLGLVIQWIPWPRPGMARYGIGAVTAGALLLVQSAVVWLYTAVTAWSHDLPGPLVWLLSLVVRLLGTAVTVDGPYLVLGSWGQPHRLAATWDLLVDCGSVCYLAAGLVLLALLVWSRLPREYRPAVWLHRAGLLLLVGAVWLPVRAAVLVAVYLHRDLLPGGGGPAHIMNHFFSPWMHLALLGGLVFLTWRFVRTPEEIGAGVAALSEATTQASAGYRQFLVGLVLVLIGTATGALGLFWEPPGLPNGRRVMIVERYAPWEPTDRPFDTTAYGENASYTYSLMYRYCGQYFEMSRLQPSDQIDNATLARCDVLVIKTPTQRYAPQEVAAVEQFVERGGGLLLIGEHTNFDRSSTCLNDIARRFGLLFRDDLLFGFRWAYIDHYRAPAVPHPILRGVPELDFSVSCSIDPGDSSGKAAIRGTALWSLPPDYNMQNYFPVPMHKPEMRGGAFVQLWAGHHARGRVAAFGDSTIFSNFCIFEPGKAELLVGMLNWLNHRSLPGDPRNLLLTLCGIVVVTGLVLARRRNDGWLVLLSAALCGFALAGGLASTFPRLLAIPLPQRQRPLPQVTLGRTLSDVPLSRGGFSADGGQGYALFEQWIPRLGYITARRNAAAEFESPMLVILNPTRTVTEEYRRRLLSYVEEGGRVLVVDTPENNLSQVEGVVSPFGLSVVHNQAWLGILNLPDGTASARIERACEVLGGERLLTLGGQRVVAARATYGKGSVTVVGFGSLFNDQSMGESWAAEPDAAMLERYSVLYALLRTAFDGVPLKLNAPLPKGGASQLTQPRVLAPQLKGFEPPLSRPWRQFVPAGER